MFRFGSLFSGYLIHAARKDVQDGYKATVRLTFPILMRLVRGGNMSTPRVDLHLPGPAAGHPATAL